MPLGKGKLHLNPTGTIVNLHANNDDSNLFQPHSSLLSILAEQIAFFNSFPTTHCQQFLRPSHKLIKINAAIEKMMQC